jgi:hypothetical protein
VPKKRHRSKHERATMKIEDKIDQNRGDRRVSHAVHRREKTLDFGSYIYMYRRERIYKEPPEEIQ